MKKWLIHFLGLIGLAAVVVASVVLAQRLLYDPEPWLSDLDHLESETAAAYANLEWAVRVDGVDPVELDRKTRRAIREAGGARGAERALNAFVEAFDDGHLRVDRGGGGRRTGSEENGGPGPDTPGKDACQDLRFRNRDNSFRLDFAGADDFRFLTAEDDPFPAGILEFPTGSKLGILRIAHFGEDGYLGYCAEEWEAFRGSLTEACGDWDCLWPFYKQLARRLLREIEGRVGLLGKQGIQALIVDLTHNGGGTDWVDPAARLLTSIPLQCNRRGFIRHSHWVGILETLEEEISADLARVATQTDRELLSTALERVRGSVEEARKECDWSRVWSEGAEGLNCSPVVRGDYFTCGLFPYLPEGSLKGVETRGSLFKPLNYGFKEGVYTGSLALLLDRWSASATEEFAALLRDNDAAVVIGELTHGSGCGYVNGGVSAELEHSGLKIRMPDCIRFRRDGANERSGIAPDLAVPWKKEDNRAERTEKLLAVLKDWRP